MRSGIGLALAALLTCACGDDGGGSNGGDGPCVNGAPGIEAHVTVSCTMLSPCEFNNPDIRINFPVVELVTFGSTHGITVEAFDAQNQATFRLPYPDGAGTGPAEAVFFALANASYHIRGTTTFDSYPTGCVMIDIAATDVPGGN